jgi:signal transduction histidine kinase
MNPRPVSPEAIVSPEITRRKLPAGGLLAAIRILWLVAAFLAIWLYLASSPARFTEMSQLPPEEVQALSRWGLTPGDHAVFHVVSEHMVVVIYLAAAFLLFWKKPGDGLVLFVAAYLLTIAVPSVVLTQQLAVFFQQIMVAFGYAGYILLFLFPDGRFIPRWTRWVALIWVAWVLLRLIFPTLDPNTWPAPGIGAGGIGLAAFLPEAAFLIVGLYAQMHRYRWFSTPEQRQQTKWVVFGLAVQITGFFIAFLPESFFPALGQPGAAHLAYRSLRKVILVFTRAIVPATVVIAILRYRLWDIDLIINRSLVYGALTGSTMALYLLVVGSLGILFQANDSRLIPFMATGMVAIAFQPLRERFQRGVNRLMYGERDDPYAVLSRLGQRLEATLEPGAVLPAIVETVAQALKLPYVAVALMQDYEYKTAAEYQHGSLAGGESKEEYLSIPLTYQNETVGQMILAPRAPGEKFSPDDLRLLEDIANQAGPAAHAVRLTKDLRQLTIDLQHSRERLVTAQEEERRRLRRDLHDGLGPALASLTLKLDAALNLLTPDHPAARSLLLELKAQTQEAITDIRRLVYALRPPALDELGLISAIREHARQYGQSQRLAIQVIGPPELPPLPAAVEVAAYRIVSEALANVVRHAQAHKCQVLVSVNQEQQPSTLAIDITDDGIGIPSRHAAGIGLNSMRERAAELGGSCTVDAAPGGGTCVRAQLPFSDPFN